MHYICTEKDLEKTLQNVNRSYKHWLVKSRVNMKCVFYSYFLVIIYIFLLICLLFIISFFFQIFHSTHGLLLQLHKSYCKKCIDVILYKF